MGHGTREAGHGTQEAGCGTQDMGGGMGLALGFRAERGMRQAWPAVTGPCHSHLARTGPSLTYVTQGLKTQCSHQLL